MHRIDRVDRLRGGDSDARLLPPQPLRLLGASGPLPRSPRAQLPPLHDVPGLRTGVRRRCGHRPARPGVAGHRGLPEALLVFCRWPESAFPLRVAIVAPARRGAQLQLLGEVSRRLRGRGGAGARHLGARPGGKSASSGPRPRRRPRWCCASSAKRRHRPIPRSGCWGRPPSATPATCAAESRAAAGWRSATTPGSSDLRGRRAWAPAARPGGEGRAARDRLRDRHARPQSHPRRRDVRGGPRPAGSRRSDRRGRQLFPVSLRAPQRHRLHLAGQRGAPGRRGTHTSRGTAPAGDRSPRRCPRRLRDPDADGVAADLDTLRRGGGERRFLGLRRVLPDLRPPLREHRVVSGSRRRATSATPSSPRPARCRLQATAPGSLRWLLRATASRRSSPSSRAVMAGCWCRLRSLRWSTRTSTAPGSMRFWPPWRSGTARRSERIATTGSMPPRRARPRPEILDGCAASRAVREYGEGSK